jgi:small-conductance mechanosensitive channel
LVTVCVTVLVALWLSGEIERRLLASENLDANMRVVLGRLVKAVLSVVALCSAFRSSASTSPRCRYSVRALAVGLGLGLQKIASNYVSGFIILLDRSIRIGNVVAVDATTSGVVTQITARYTVVRTLDRHRGDHPQRVSGVEYRAQRIVYRLTRCASWYRFRLPTVPISSKQCA